MSFKVAIETYPLQAYASALLFSPSESLIRRLFEKEQPNWITIKPNTEETWNACLQTLGGHHGRVNSAAFSHSSALLASGGLSGIVKLWDASNGACLKTLGNHREGEEDVKSVFFSHDSLQLASVSSRRINVWDTSSGECLHSLGDDQSFISSAMFSHDSKTLFTAWDHLIKIWDIESEMCLQTFGDSKDSIVSLTRSHDSTRLVVGHANAIIKIWDCIEGECLQTLDDHSSPITSVVFSHDSTLIASGSTTGSIKIWSVNDRVKCLLTLEGHKYSVSSVGFSHDSTSLASASFDHSIKLWDVSTGMCQQTFRGHGSWVSSVAFSHDSKTLVSSSSDHTIKLWDISGALNAGKFESHNSFVDSVAFSHDLKRMASASPGDRTLKIWDVESFECLQTLERDVPGGTFFSATFSHDPARVISTSLNDQIIIWDTSSGEPIYTIKGLNNDRAIAFSPDSSLLAVASPRFTDRAVNMYDAASGRYLHSLKSHNSDVFCVSFSDDSMQLASSSAHGDIKIWDIWSGDCLDTLEGQGAEVNCITFSHDSKRLAVATYDEWFVIKIWNADSGVCQTMRSAGSQVQSLTFSHDSKLLVSSTVDGIIQIWDVTSSNCLQTLWVGMLVKDVAFDLADSRLLTPNGTIVLGTLPASSAANAVEIQLPQYEGGAIEADWITFNNERILWLPSEYRANRSVVSGNTIGIGSRSGKVWQCKFNPELRDISPSGS